jgi:hypothetical protein
MKKYEFYMEFIGGAKNLESHFAKMAEKGWQIQRIGLLFNRYVKAEPQKTRFCVDVLPEIGNWNYPQNHDVKSYHSICEDAGWEFVTSQRQLHVFRANENAEPLELHTDNRVQCQAFMKAFARRECIVNLVGFVIILSSLFPVLAMGAGIFFNDTFLFLLAGMALPAIWKILYIFAGAAWFFKTLRAARLDQPLPVINRRFCRFLTQLNFWGMIFLFVLTTIGFFLETRNGLHVGFAASVILIVLVNFAIILMLWRSVENTERTRSENIRFLAIGAVVMVFASGIALNIAGSFFPTEVTLTQVETRVQITTAELGLEPFGAVFSRDRRTSVAVPVYFAQWEYQPGGRGDRRIFIQKCEAINSRVAQWIFTHWINERIEWAALLAGHRLGNELERDPALSCVEFWEADDVTVLSADTRLYVILRRGNNVIRFSTENSDEIEIYTLRDALRVV